MLPTPELLPYKRFTVKETTSKQVKIQDRLQRTMKNDGWPSVSWPIRRLFSRFHTRGMKNKTQREVPEETVTKARHSIEKPSRKDVGLARHCQFIL